MGKSKERHEPYAKEIMKIFSKKRKIEDKKEIFKELKCSTTGQKQSAERVLVKMIKNKKLISGIELKLDEQDKLIKYFIFISTRHDNPKPAGKEEDYQETIRKKLIEASVSYEDADVEAESEGAGRLYSPEVDILMGNEFDLLMSVWSESPSTIFKFVRNKVRYIPNVDRTHTSWSVKLPSS